MAESEKLYMILRNADGSWTYNKNFILEFPLIHMAYSLYQYLPMTYLPQQIGKKVICVFYGSTSHGTADAQFLVTGHLNEGEPISIGREREVKEEVCENYKDLLFEISADHMLGQKYKVGDYLFLKDEISILEFFQNISNCQGKEDNNIFAIGIVSVSQYLISELQTAEILFRNPKSKFKKIRKNFQVKSENLYDAINNSIERLGIDINQIINNQKIKGTKKEEIRELSRYKINNNLDFVKLEKIVRPKPLKQLWQKQTLPLKWNLYLRTKSPKKRFF